MPRWAQIAIVLTLFVLLGGCASSANQERLTPESDRLTAENAKLTQENQRLQSELQRQEETGRAVVAELDRYRDLYSRLVAETSSKRRAAARIPASLINAHYATQDDSGWTYRKYLNADLDADGTAERVLVATSAGVDPKTGQVAWDDGHVWRVYVEETNGKRTLVFSDWVQLGRLEVSLGEDPAGLLLEARGGAGVVVYQALYKGPDQVEAFQLFDMLIRDRASSTPDFPIYD